MRGALLIALVIAVVGCGVAESASAPPAKTSLAISYWPQGRGTGTPTKWTLRCEPTGGTLPRAARACSKLGAIAEPFAPVRDDVMCTDQFGGPQQAIVSGTFERRRIWILLAARNGCEIARAQRLEFLVPGFSAGGA